MNTYLGASSYLAPTDVDEAFVRIAELSISKVICGTARPPRRRSRRPRDRPRRRAQGGAHFVGFVLRRPVSRRIHRADALSGLVDTIFANTDEVLSLYETPNFDEALGKLRAEGVLGIVTRSEKGSIVVNGDETYEVPASAIAARRHHRRRRHFRRRLSRGLARRAQHVAAAARGAGGGRDHQHIGARPQVRFAGLAKENGVAVIIAGRTA